MDPTQSNQIVLTWLARFTQLTSPYVPLRYGEIRIAWNPRMRSRAGVADSSKWLVQLNPNIIRDPKTLEEVLVHELCHLAVFRRWPYAQAHGKKWKDLMRRLGFDPRRCHSYPVEGLRLQKKWSMVCQCQEHLVSTTIYNRIQKGTRYKCIKCKERLVQRLGIASPG